MILGLLSSIFLISLVAIIFPFKPFVNRKQAFGILCLSFIIIAIFSDKESNDINNTKDQPQVKKNVENIAIDKVVPVKKGSRKKEKEAFLSKWFYYQDQDKMTQKNTYFASLSSENYINFSFPYSGRQKAKLMLRTHPQYGKDLILSVEKGQFSCNSYNGCKVKVRFDNANLVTYSAFGPSDNSTTLIFIKNYSNFAGKMMRAKKVFIQAGFYQEGSPVFEFDVRGFDVKKYRPNK